MSADAPQKPRLPLAIQSAEGTTEDPPNPERLERDSGHFAAIVASSDDAIISKDLNGIVLSWNTAAERLFGYAAAEIVGRSIRLIIPSDRQAEEDAVLEAVRRGAVVDHFETIRLRKDGGNVRISLTVSPIRSHAGVIIGASKIARDLTKIHRTQRDALLLASIVDSSDDAIVSKDLEGTITSWNVAAERLFGFTASEMIGQSVRLLIPDGRQSQEDSVLARVRAGKHAEHYETVRRRKDGSLVPVSLTVSPILNEEGVVIGASKIARDISERERAEQERQRLLAIARDASQLKDEFLATLSHELRTPLNAIVGYVRLMEFGLLTGDKQTRAMEAVSRNVKSLTQIVEDVLDVSRIVSGKLRLEMQPVQLAPLIMDAIDTVRPAAEAKGVHLDPILDPRAPDVSGDPERLKQVLWNILSNAVKFTDRGGRVEVRLTRAAGHVGLAVVDTGIGIPSEFLPHLFERFRQADSGINRTHGGLGLGLAISRHLVELQGGRISATSEGLGHGTTVLVELPVRSAKGAVPSNARDAAPTDAIGQIIAVPELRGVCILAVDDDRDALALVREILEATGATVVTADSGLHAWNTIQRTKPDVLLTDLGMPHMTGFDLISKVRGADDPAIRSIPAAALTAYVRSEDRTRALRSGFQLHLSKPIEPAELMAAIASLAGR